MRKEKIFDQFINKYSLSKTLRFELKPVGKTKDILRENKVFEKDQTIYDSYNQAKFYFDKLHQRFINSALGEVKIKKVSFQDFATFIKEKNEDLLIKRRGFNEARKISDQKKLKSLQKEINLIESEISDRKKLLSKEIHDLFNEEAENWKKKYKGVILEDGEKIRFSKPDMKQEGVSFLTSAGILQILKYEFPKSKESEFQKNDWPSLYVEEQENIGEKRYIFDSFDKFSGYLSNFQKTRDNLYDQNLKSSAIATRIINNFEIFLANRETFHRKYENNHGEIGFNDTHVFKIDHYYSCLLQKGIDGLEQGNDDNSYNKVIGRINQNIKEHRDKLTLDVKKEKGKNFKKNDCPLFKKLDKQILGEVEKEKEFIENTGDKEKDNEIFLIRFNEFIDLTQDRFSKARRFMNKFFNNEFASSYDNVFIKNTTINTISRRWFAEGYGREFELFLPQKTKNRDEKEEPKVKQFITLSDVMNAVEQLDAQPFKQSYYDQKTITEEQGAWQQFLAIWKYEFDSLFSGMKRKDGEVIVPEYDDILKEAKELSSFDRSKEKIAVVKNYADGSLRIFQLMKYLAIDDRDKDKITGQRDTNFYAELDDYTKDFEFIRYYNAFRNFVTKKVSDENKIKLNFEKGNLLGGWAESPEGNAQFYAYILKRDEKYFLGITDYSNILDFNKFPEDQGDEAGSYRKMFYKQLKSQTIYGSMYESRYGNKYSKDKKDLAGKELVKRIKDLLHDQVCYFPSLKTIIKKDHPDPDSLAIDLSDANLYSLTFNQQLNNSYVEKIVHGSKDKKRHLYLFEITNKDLSKESGSVKNIHTLYFKNLFSDLNLANPSLKLSGGAEIFFRKATEDLPMKKDKKGNVVVDHKRYAEDKILFHLPVVINLNAGKAVKFNQEINRVISSSTKGPNIIGLDRGEKHLVYYSVINQAGEILDQGSLNEINEVDYHSKLIDREAERLSNRQSWEPVAKIKDLKRGYVSQVVRKIANLAINYDAIVAMEDLNMRFKQVRGGIERSVYQQIEKQLIDKFGYLIFKDRDPQDIGGVMKGYQLSAPFKSFEKMGKQTGIIFYTQADYTSITDPLTGFRKNIYIKSSSSQEKIKDVIEKFKKIGWDEEEHSYFFNYDPSDFHDGIDLPTPDGGWSVYAKAPRIRREKGRDGYWSCTPINVNEKMEELFKLWGFKELRAQDMREEIFRKKLDGELKGKKVFDGKEKNFYESFIYLFNLILQLRNSFSLQIKMKDGKLESVEEGVDFIASPVKPFFATNAEKDGKVLSKGNLSDFEKMISPKERDRILTEFNGDANGAYNIARKGILILKAIKKNSERPDLFISKKKWDDFAQNQWNPISKSRK